MFKHIVVVASVISTVILILLMNLTTPAEIGAMGVLLFFVLAYIISFGVFSGLIYLGYRIKARLIGGASSGVISGGTSAISEKAVYRYGAVLGFLPIMLVVSQGSWLGILISIGFASLVCFIVSK
jgi:hypothetical protein